MPLLHPLALHKQRWDLSKWLIYENMRTMRFCRRCVRSSTTSGSAFRLRCRAARAAAPGDCFDVGCCSGSGGIPKFCCAIAVRPPCSRLSFKLWIHDAAPPCFHFRGTPLSVRRNWSLKKIAIHPSNPSREHWLVAPLWDDPKASVSLVSRTKCHAQGNYRADVLEYVELGIQGS